jgi:hypothetical protein
MRTSAIIASFTWAFFRRDEKVSREPAMRIIQRGGGRT